jgi:hypothetical protein
MQLNCLTFRAYANLRGFNLKSHLITHIAVSTSEVLPENKSCLSKLLAVYPAPLARSF